MKKLKIMKKKCDGCKALQLEHAYDGKCLLGFKIGKRPISSYFYGYKPLEECPKPTTWDSFNKEYDKRRIKRGKDFNT